MDLMLDPAAEAEIEAAAVYYQKIDERLRHDFLAEVDEAFDRILTYPHIWKCVVKHYRRLNLKRFPFAIIYALEESIYIIAVMHERRKPNYWLRRERERKR